MVHLVVAVGVDGRGCGSGGLHGAKAKPKKAFEVAFASVAEDDQDVRPLYVLYPYPFLR